MKYAMFICMDPEPTEADDDAAPSIDDWFDYMIAKGAYRQGIRLQPRSEAFTVRVRDGEVLVTDGPYTESKEWIAGLAIIECETRDEAIAQALKHNMAYQGRLELRPIHSMGGPDDPYATEPRATDQRLLNLLDAQRSRALEIIDGLDEKRLRTPVVSSGWTVLGLIEHLAGAERHWLQQVARGFEDPRPADGRSYDPDAPFVTDRPADTVIADYRQAVATGNAILATLAWDSAPAGSHGVSDHLVPDIRSIVLHLVEETARHLGHLDLARELLDGATGRGQDSL